jgi:hypothetical protein
MDKAIRKQIKEGRWKEKEEKCVRKSTNVMAKARWVTKRITKKLARKLFVLTWFVVVVRKASELFHYHVQASLRTNPYSKYTTINVNYILLANEQKVNEARKQVMDRMQTCGNVATKFTFLTTS